MLFRSANATQKAEANAARQEHLANIAGGRDAEGNVGTGEAGNNTPLIMDTVMGVPPAAEEHEARAHVQLPPPPEGGLQTIDDLDASIQSLEAQVQAQAANTGEARAAASSAQANAAQLGQLHQQVENRGDTADARQADAQRVSQQNAEARQRTDAQNGSAAQGVERVKTPLEQIAGPARFVNGIIQRVPSNRFINVDGPKRSLAQFVQAIDTITGHGQQQEIGRAHV